MTRLRPLLAAAVFAALVLAALAWGLAPRPPGGHPTAGCLACHPGRAPAWHGPEALHPEVQPGGRRAHAAMGREHRGSCGACHAARFQVGCAACHLPGVLLAGPDLAGGGGRP